MIQLLITVVVWASTAEAYTVFTPSCTTANQTTSFVRSPDTRGTLDILWSCLFTIIACTWTIQHLNIPRQRRGQDPGWKGDLKWLWLGFWTKLKWMLVTMLAPELIVGKSWEDLANANADLPELRKVAASDGMEWSLMHSMFADMGGFIMVGNTGQESEVLEKTDNALNATSPLKPNTKDSVTEGVEGVAAQPPTTKVPQIRHENPFHLTAAGILRLRRAGHHLPKRPSVTSDEIQDKSKSDAFARTISIIQIGWISIQAIARAIRRLPVSQLEIAVVAFSVSAIIIYGLCWPKPKGVSVPYTLLSFPGDIPQEIIQVVLKNDDDFLVIDSWINTVFSLEAYEVLGSPIANDCSAISETFTSRVYGFGVLIGCLVFGGLHLAAWNFEFPTTIEQTIWRATSIYSTVYMLLMVFSAGVTASGSFIQTWLFRIESGLYVLARLFLLVEIFRSLFFLPPEAYISTWAANIPHLS